MKVSKAQAAETHERILQTAGRLFREKGFDGVGVAELMKTAGLTNGAFYGHFASKEDLIAKACARVMSGGEDPWAALLDGAAPLDAFVRGYLSTRHAEARGEGCLFAALGGEVARQPAPVRASFTENLRRRIAALGRALDGGEAARREDRAIATMAAMVGALTLARAVDDSALAGEILRATARELGGR